MNPIKELSPASTWLIRVLTCFIVYQKYFDTFLTFQLKGSYYFFSLSFILSALMLFIGGFTKSHLLSMIMGFILFVLSVSMIIMGEFSFDAITHHFALLTLGFYFFARGNS